MNVRKMLFYLMAAGVGLRLFEACAATPVASVVGDAEALIDTRVSLGAYSETSDALIDTRINFVARSAAPGAKIDTLTPGGTLIVVR